MQTQEVRPTLGLLWMVPKLSVDIQGQTKAAEQPKREHTKEVSCGTID